MANLSAMRRMAALWSAALSLESAARAALPHLPPDEKKALEIEIKHFNSVRKSLLNKAP